MNANCVQRKLIVKIFYKLFSLSRPTKRAIQVMVDCALISLCFWLAMALRLDGLLTEIKLKSWFTLVAIIPLTIFTFARLGLYRSMVRYMTDKAVTVILIGAVVSSGAMFSVSQYFSLEVPRSVPGIYFSILVMATGGTRLLMRTLYLVYKDAGRLPVAIYGAGSAGRLLLRSLQEHQNYRPELFVDDDTKLQGTDIEGTPILGFDAAKKKISKSGMQMAFIAIGDNDTEGQRKAATSMASLGLEVRIIPKIADLIAGRAKISSLRRLEIEELLGREKVQPNPALMSRTIDGRSVMVTGAGGSIGSELCRQAVTLNPSRLVLVEASEYALYTIMEELNAVVRTQNYALELVPVLGSVTRQEVIEKAIIENDVATIFHAAAYKHVPLVEENASEAVRNNVLGTHLLAQAAGRLGVRHFVFISTDKAVRPTSIMGATKRLAELSVSAAANVHSNTSFCSVRFGNVLGSSGSVVPKFEKQIKSGGPITLTHPDIIRYFMTIQEAAQLVIQASAMAENGNVFVLDMGKPVRILDLAHTICALHGKYLHTDETKKAPADAITLDVTGLRPGEKLFEELLVTGLELDTLHPKIKCEPSVGSALPSDIDIAIDRLLKCHGNEVIAKALAEMPLDYKMDKRH